MTEAGLSTRRTGLLISTERLVLREFREDDFGAILAYQSDPRYLHYYGLTERDPEDVRRLHAWFVQHGREEPRTKFQLAITLPESGMLVGNVGVRKEQMQSTEAGLGCELAPEYWGKGYATEAVRAMLTFAFVELGLHRVWAQTIADNRAAWRVLEKVGLKREGELRETSWLRDHWGNSYVYGILEEEWRR